MDINALLDDPVFRQSLIALGSWAVAQLAKKWERIPISKKTAPYVAILTGILANVSTGATGDSLPTQALIGALSGLMAAGGHEVGSKAVEGIKTRLTPPTGNPNQGGR